MEISSRQYLYKTVYNGIRSKIEDGIYAPESLLPSEREIGEIYHVDRTTVRKALTLLVEENLVAKQAGVGTRVLNVKKAEVSAPVSAQGGSIAFLLPHLASRGDLIMRPYYSSLFFNIEKECRRLGYSLFHMAPEQEEHFAEVLSSHRLSSIVFVSDVERHIINLALEHKIPSVLISEYGSALTGVVPDNFNGMLAACNHLIEYGHTKFAIIKGLPHYLATQERMNACTTAFARAGLRAEDMVYGECAWDVREGYRVTREILSKGAKPTAMIAFNDSIAMGCIQAAYDFGLRIPEDVSIVGFDDIEQASYTSPPLTTVHVDTPAIAQIAVQILMDQISNPNGLYNFKISVPCSLVVRSSTARRTKKESKR